MPKQNKQPTSIDNPKPKSKALLCILGCFLLAVLLISIGLVAGWYFAHQQEDMNPYQVLKGYESSRHQFIVKSSELSVKIAQRAIEKLKNKDVPGAISDCNIAIDLFPLDTKPYILLAKLYLMSGQERLLYDTLTLAGRSYPNFNNILKIIDDEDLDNIPLEEPTKNVYLANFSEDKKTAVSYMFDDGEADVYQNLPIFDKYGYKCTIPVVAGFVAESSSDPFWGSWGQWKDAAMRGYEIANHSMYHRDSKTLHGADFDIAIDQAKQIIEENIGQPVMTYVFPHDSYTDEAVARALKVHKAIRTPEFLQAVYPRTVEIVLGGPYVSLESGNRLIDIGLKRKLWLVFKCHGISSKRTMRSFKSITPEFLDGNLSYIHSRENEIWIDTFARIFDYMNLRVHTQIDVSNQTSNSLDLVLHQTDSQEKLTVPLTVVIKAKAAQVKATASNGHSLKAWGCEADGLCVDVDAYSETVHVQWQNLN